MIYSIVTFSEDLNLKSFFCLDVLIADLFPAPVTLRAFGKALYNTWSASLNELTVTSFPVRKSLILLFIYFFGLKDLLHCNPHG